MSNKPCHITHVVIDMDDDLSDKHPLLLQAVFRQTDFATANHHRIILLSYTGENAVGFDNRIIARLASYDKRELLLRELPDGSPEIAELEGIGETEVFRLYGTFADACVAATAYGLAQKFPQARLEVVTDACIAVLGKFGWAMDYLHEDVPPNIVLVREDGRHVRCANDLPTT